MLLKQEAKKPLRARLRIYERKKAALQQELELPGVTYASWLSTSDSGLIVGVFEQSVALHAPGAQAWRTLVKGSVPSIAVPSADARRLFVTPKPGEPLIVDVATAKVVHQWRGGAPADAAWIGLDAVAVVGGGAGIRILEPGGYEVLSAHDAAFHAVAVSEDAKALCAHSRDSHQLACYFAQP